LETIIFRFHVKLGEGIQITSVSYLDCQHPGIQQVNGEGCTVVGPTMVDPGRPHGKPCHANGSHESHLGTIFRLKFLAGYQVPYKVGSY